MSNLGRYFDLFESFVLLINYSASCHSWQRRFCTFRMGFGCFFSIDENIVRNKNGGKPRSSSAHDFLKESGFEVKLMELYRNLVIR